LRKVIDPLMAKLVSSLILFVLSVSLGSPCQARKSRECGYERWPVKVLADKDRAQIDPKPIDTTVAALSALAIHEVPYPYDRRIAPEELHIFRIKARLLQVRREKDSDLHLLLQDLDESDQRMIAEVPAPDCAEGTGHEQEYLSVRRTLMALPAHTVLELTGVGFFDFLHDQKGGANNGFEIHPILSIKKID